MFALSSMIHGRKYRISELVVNAHDVMMAELQTPSSTMIEAIPHRAGHLASQIIKSALALPNKTSL